MARTKHGRSKGKTTRQKKIKKVMQKQWRNDLKITHGNIELNSEALYTKEARYRKIRDEKEPGDMDRIKATKKLATVEELIKTLIDQNNGEPLFQEIEIDVEIDGSSEEDAEDDEDSDSAVSISSVEAGIRVANHKGKRRARSPSFSLSPVGATILPATRNKNATATPLTTQLGLKASSGSLPKPSTSTAAEVPKEPKAPKGSKAPKIPKVAKPAAEVTLRQTLPEVAKKKRGRKPKANTTDEATLEAAAPSTAAGNIYSGRLRNRAPITTEPSAGDSAGALEIVPLSPSQAPSTETQN